MRAALAEKYPHPWYSSGAQFLAKAADTRGRIMDAAQDAVLAKGFAATSIDEIVAAAEVTRSGFFYHFKDKNTLARALLDRYIDDENALFDRLFERARELHEDPLHAMLVGLKLMSELMADLPEAHPGCLVATTCYQDQLFDPEVRDLNRQAFLGWRARFRHYFDEIAARYPPREATDLDALADMVSGMIEGGLILSRAFRDRQALVGQVLMLRQHVKLLFEPRLP